MYNDVTTRRFRPRQRTLHPTQPSLSSSPTDIQPIPPTPPTSPAPPTPNYNVIMMVRNDQRSSFEAKEHHGHQTVGIRRFSSLQRAGPRSDACPHHRRRDRRDIPSRRTLRNRRNHDPAPADPRPADPQPDRRHHLPVHGACAGIRLDEAGPNGTRPHAQPHRGARLRRRDRGIPAFGHRIVPRADPGRAQCRAVHARQRRAIPRRRRQSVPLGLFVGRSGRAARGGRACRRPYRHGRHVAVAGAERRRRVGCDAGRDRLFRRCRRC